MIYEAFISYRRVDSAIAKRIYDALTEQRHQVFFDVNSLLAGDFTAEIKAAIRDSELVVALLTCESVRRMADNPQADMVRKELETARQEARPIQFLWLMEEGGAQSALYDQLAAYPEDELLGWLAGQNIMPFAADDGDVRRICGKVLETLEAERRRKFEQLRASTHQELHQKFAVGDRQYSYHGTSRLSLNGKSFPYGEGTMVDESSPFAFLVYEGNWDGDENFSGQGTVYREKKDGTRTKLYQGHWRNLKYHDSDGRLFDEETGACVYQGYFLEGKRLGEDGLCVFHMELYAPDDAERKDPLYSGSAQALPTSAMELQRCLYGEEQLNDGRRFRGWYQKGRPASGDMSFPGGERYSGEVGRHTTYGKGQKREFCGPTGFGRMIYPNGQVYEGEWGTGLYDFQWSGYGIALYPGDGLEVRVEGCFQAGLPSVTREVEAKVSVRQTGEQQFRQVYYSAANDVHFPGRDSSGHGRFTFRDGSIYDGILRGLSLHKGRLYTPDGREYAIDRTSFSAGIVLGVNGRDQEAVELVLRCLDELWETFRPVMERNPQSWREFQLETFQAATHDERRSGSQPPPEYPSGSSQARRALAMCSMPPSRLFLLGSDELGTMRTWFREHEIPDLESLKQQAEQEGPAQEAAAQEAAPEPVPTEALDYILPSHIRTQAEAFQYLDQLEYQPGDPDFIAKITAIAEQVKNLPYS